MFERPTRANVFMVYDMNLLPLFCALRRAGVHALVPFWLEFTLPVMDQGPGPVCTMPYKYKMHNSCAGTWFDWEFSSR